MIDGLGVRDWVCSDGGGQHERDINVARNILNLGVGCKASVDGIPGLQGGTASKTDSLLRRKKL